MTLIGRFSLQSETLVNPSITSFFMTLSGDPLTPSDLIRLWDEQKMSERHPRFLQRVSSDSPGYFEATGRPLERFITEALYPTDQQNIRREIQTRIQHLQMSAWDLGDALWHLYVAPWREPRPSLLSPAASTSTRSAAADVDDDGVPWHRRSLLLFRAHHALADGASLNAALSDLFDEAAEFRAQAAELLKQHRQAADAAVHGLRRRLLRLLRLLAAMLQAGAYHLRLLWLSSRDPDPWRILQLESSSANDVEDGAPPSRRRVVSFVDEAAPVEQVKRVARQLAGPGATMNDVLVACVTAAVARQLQSHRNRRSAVAATTTDAPPLLPAQPHFHVSVPVHLTGGAILPGESLGNKLGAFVVRVPGEAMAPPPTPVNDAAIGETTSAPTTTSASTARLREVHHQLFVWKRSAVPWTSHLLAKALSAASHALPAGWVSGAYRRSNAGSIAVVTNVRGPSRKVHIGSRTVESFHGFVPLPPGVPIGVVVGSYDGNVTLTLTAEPWAVPDGDRFLAWVLDEYLNLLQEASKAEAA